MTLLFEMTEESQDQIRIDVGKVHVVGRFTELSRAKPRNSTSPSGSRRPCADSSRVVHKILR